MQCYHRVAALHRKRLLPTARLFCVGIFCIVYFTLLHEINAIQIHTITVRLMGPLGLFYIQRCTVFKILFRSWLRCPPSYASVNQHIMHLSLSLSIYFNWHVKHVFTLPKQCKAISLSYTYTEREREVPLNKTHSFSPSLVILERGWFSSYPVHQLKVIIKPTRVFYFTMSYIAYCLQRRVLLGHTNIQQFALGSCLITFTHMQVNCH